MWAQLREHSPAHVLAIADTVWEQRNLFIRWPKRDFVFIPGCVRPKSDEKHQYTDEQKMVIQQAGLKPDARSNGPAIVAFLLAGGERPQRIQSSNCWSIHHIYNGRFPWPGRPTSVCAVKDGRYFTASAGLAAIHPVAEALADEVPYFSWLLRHHAFVRFGFDPDGIFASSPGTLLSLKL